MTDEETNDTNVCDLTAKVVGDFGPWQLRIGILMSLLKLPMAWYQMNIIFMAPPQEFWCQKPDKFSTYSNDEWRKIYKPLIEEQPCLIFDPEILAMNPGIDCSLIPLVECNKFVYNTTVFHRTITSEWNLVCSKHWLVHLTQCIMMWGVLLGGIIFGVIADTYGRRKPLMIAIIIQALASYAASIFPLFGGWIVIWFILALCSGGIGIISFVMCMESVSGKWRTIIPILYQLPFGFGSAIMACIAYFFRDWRQLEFALASISTLYILYWFWIPESPRWLLATGQFNKAIEVLQQIAIQNHREFDEHDIRKLIPNIETNKHNHPGFVAFFKLKNMRLKTLLLSANWFCTGLAFYAFSQYLGMIGENIFLTVGISGIIYVPGGLICLLIIPKVGRRPTVWIFQVLTALCFLLIVLIPKNVFVNDWPRLSFAGIGFGGLAGSVPALFLYSGELFPTLGRNAGVGGVTTFARIAAIMIAPAFVSLNSIIPDLPLMLLTIITFAQLILILPLPETKDYPLPDTIEEAEKVSRFN
ncbi:hypothetical protein ACJJTC_013976 [Scirpophaga incertulas]